jgi:CheY-like chemotaxis protein
MAEGSKYSKILLVEDEEAIAKPLIKLLSIRGFDTEWAKDGLEALEHLRKGTQFHCLLVDIMMPRMDGWTLREKIKETAQFANIPLIFLSADNSSAKEAKNRKEMFVSKPIDLNELEQQIKGIAYD